ncbi:putative niacin/nicotinamide transporter NaiP [compost metagenome]
MTQEQFKKPKNVALIILVASLGYFVDIYDLVIFSIVRIQSFKDIGVHEDLMRKQGEFVINVQMAGLLLGGFIWGIIGDKYGRLKVLFGSILLYSVANIINGFVNDVNTYAIIRFIAGIGLAGELGAGITLVSESMPKNKRGYGTMIVAGVGVLGAAAAYFVAEHFNWRNAYFVGGGMGLLLLLLRVGIFESSMFQQATDEHVARGKFSMILTSKERLLRYLYCLGIGLPLWFVVGILITQAPEFGKALGSPDVLSAGKGIMLAYIGISIGEVIAGFIAQMTRSRRLVLAIFHVASLIAVFIYLGSKGITEAQFGVLSFCLGLSVGYWATFVTVASEQFGTNLRATVTTTAPNFIRGFLIPVTFLFEFFVNHFGIINAGYIVMCILAAVSLFCTYKIRESFNLDLNYVEK